MLLKLFSLILIGVSVALILVSNNTNVDEVIDSSRLTYTQYMNKLFNKESELAKCGLSLFRKSNSLNLLNTYALYQELNTKPFELVCIDEVIYNTQSCKAIGYCTRDSLGFVYKLN